MTKRFLIIFSLLLCCTFSYAQKTKKEKKKRSKELPENIEAFPKNFLIRPRFVYPQVWVDVSSRLTGKGANFRYKPAMPGIVGLSLKIKKVFISAAIKLPATQEFKNLYGDSKSRNIFINIMGRRVIWTLFYRDYKSFYLEKYQPFYPTWNKDSLGYPKSKDLRIIEGGLNLVFNFNKNFSMNAAFSQGERQKKSAGSFLMGIAERYQRIDADTNFFVPPGQDSYYPNLAKLKYGNFASTILAFGFGYQFVAGKFHFTPVVMAGTGFQFQSYEQTTGKKTWVNVPTYANAKAQVGYNGDHFFTNIIYQLEYNTIPIKESRIKLFHNWIEFGLGLRF